MLLCWPEIIGLKTALNVGKGCTFTTAVPNPLPAKDTVMFVVRPDETLFEDSKIEVELEPTAIVASPREADPALVINVLKDENDKV